MPDPRERFRATRSTDAGIEAPVTSTVREHWPEYLIEAAALGCFMISACLFGALLEHPDSVVRRALPSAWARRMLMGIAMGLTAIAIIYSPWGKRSGAHMNPAVTLTFLRLGKVAPIDGLFYWASQVVGGLAGVLLARAALGDVLSHPAVHYVATLPGAHGLAAAFAAEVAITFGLMSVVLVTTHSRRLASSTGLFCGALVALYVTFEAPISGMSMNPARTLASAVPAGELGVLWLYVTAPPLGMLLAAETYAWRRGTGAVECAKLHHRNDERCIFCGKEKTRWKRLGNTT
jgi:aquaporin Z